MYYHLSPLLIEHKKEGTMTYDIGNLGPDLEQTQTCGRVKPVNESQKLLASLSTLIKLVKNSFRLAVIDFISGPVAHGQ
jgi:hypothetical protein